MPPEPDEAKKGAPRYIVGYASIMTLLLAFFIIMQAFADVQDEGLFYTGQGSFIRAIDTFGLGGIWQEARTGVTGESVNPRYAAAEGEDRVPEMRRIDPELEDAQMALEELERLFATDTPQRGRPWVVVFSTRASYAAGQRPLSDHSAELLSAFGRQLRRAVPMLMAQGCVVRVGTVLNCTQDEAPRLVPRAFQALAAVKLALLDAMPPRLRRRAADRFYSFCQREPAAARPADLPAGQIRVDVVLTKYTSENPR